MGSGGVAIAALPTVICIKVPFSDGLGGACILRVNFLFLHTERTNYISIIQCSDIFIYI